MTIHTNLIDKNGINWRVVDYNEDCVAVEFRIDYNHPWIERIESENVANALAFLYQFPDMKEVM